MLSDQSVEFACGNCNHKLHVKMKDMKPGGSITCPSCGAITNFTGDDISKPVAQFDKAISDIQKAFKKFGK
ncbi:MAG: hypothetical protein AB7U93_13860 [Deferribacterales bacterium]